MKIIDLLFCLCDLDIELKSCCGIGRLRHLVLGLRQLLEDLDLLEKLI